MAHEDDHEDDLGIDIDIWVDEEGSIFQVDFKGQAVRARVNHFGVEFPCLAGHLKRDEDGDLYTETIV